MVLLSRGRDPARLQRAAVPEADIVAEVRTPRERETFIPIEVEAKRRCGPSWDGCTLLWAKHPVPNFPVAVYLRGGRSGVMDEKFVMGLFEREHLRFQFPAVALARFEAREYVEKGGAVAAALASLMSRRKAGPPAELKVSMMERVVKSALDEARKFLLLNLIEANFKLGAADRRELERRLSEKRYREKKMQLTWAEKLERKVRKEGRKEGRQEGLLEGKREALLRQLKTKFGPLPEEIISQVRAVQSLRELDRYLDRVLVASSLADMGLRR